MQKLVAENTQFTVAESAEPLGGLGAGLMCDTCSELLIPTEGGNKLTSAALTGAHTSMPRLACAAKLVQKGRVACDIGCDHGKLAVALVASGISPKVIAVDVRPLPLERAKKLVQKLGLEEFITCRLGDGLGALAAHEADEIVIAGLSGETMIKIIAACDWVKSADVHFVLVPAGSHTRLRRWLCVNGFELKEEHAVMENGRPYTVMSVFYVGECYKPSEIFCQLGLVPQNKNDAAIAYMQKKLRHLAKKSKAIKTIDEQRAHSALVNEVEKCLQFVK